MALKVGELFATLNLATGGFDKGLGKASQAFKKFGLLAVDVLGSFMKDSVEAGMNFDTAMSQLAATMGKSVDELDELRAKALEMGSTTKFTASEAAEGLNILAQAGLNAQEQIAGIGTVLDLASAGAISMDTSATYLSATVKGFGDDMANSAKYADLMAKGATLANTSVNDLGAALSGVAASANSYGQSVETTTLALLRMAEQNITAGEAATGLKRAMQVLYAPSSTAAKAMKQLGVSAYDAKGNARDFNDIIADLDKSMKALNNDAKKNALASDIFGARGLTVFNALVSSSEDKVASFVQGISEATGSAASQAATQLDNLQGDITIFGSAVEGLQIAVTQSSTGMIRDAVQGATGVVDAFHTAFAEGLTPESLQGVFGAMGDVLQNVGPQLGDMILNGMDALSGLVPSIVDNISGMLKKAVKGIQKLLPNIIKNVISAIPSLLGGLVEIAPELASALFEAAGTAVEELIGMLPELIPQLLKGVATIIPKLGEGVMKLFQGIFNGFDQIALDTGLRNMNLEEVISSAIDNATPEKIDDVTLPDVTIDGEIDTTDYKAKIEGAISAIKTAIAGLSLTDAEKKELERAILSGSGSDALGIAFRNLGATTAESDKAVAAIGAMKAALNTALGDLGLDEGTEEKILQYASGALNLKEALADLAGLSPTEAESALNTVQDTISSVLLGMGLDETTVKAIQDYVAAGGSLEDALTTIGNLTPGQAATALDQIKTQLVDAFSGFGISDEDAKNIRKLTGYGSSLARALETVKGLDPTEAESKATEVKQAIQEMLTGFGIDDQTAADIAEFVAQGGELKKGITKYTNIPAEKASAIADQVWAAIPKMFDTLELDPAVATNIASYIEQGGSLEDALKLYAGLDPESAKAKAAELQPALDELIATYNSLNLDGIDLSTFIGAATATKGDIVTALKMLGMSDADIEAALNSMDELADSISTRIQTAMDKVKEAFTNGKAGDDIEAAEEAKKTLEESEKTLTEKVDTWLSDYKSQLDQMNLSAADYQAAVAAAEAKAATMKDEITTTISAADQWIDDMAGKSTKYVKDHIGELDALIGNIDDIEARIETLEGRVQSTDLASRKLVETGHGNRSMQTKAIATTAAEREKAELDAAKKLQEAEEKYAAEAARNAELYGEGTDAYNQAMEEADAEFNDANEQYLADMEAAKENYITHMDAIRAAILASNQELQEAITQGAEESSTRDTAGELLQGIVDSFGEEGKADLSWEDFLSGLNIKDSDISSIAKALGIEPDKFSEALQYAFENGGSGMGAKDAIESFFALNGLDPDSLKNYAEGSEQALADALSGIDLNDIATPFATAEENGWLMDGFEDPKAMLPDAIDEMFQKAVAEIGNNPEEIGGDITEPLADTIESGAEDVKRAGTTTGEAGIEGLRDGSGAHSPSVFAMEIGQDVLQGLLNGLSDYSAVTTAATLIGSSIIETIGSGATGANFTAFGTTLISNLKSAVATAAASGGLAEAGAAIAASLREGMEGTDFSGLSGILSSALSGVGSGLSLSDQGVSIGKSMTDGLAKGIRDGKSQVIKAAAEVATAAIREAKNKLEVHSPSRVFAEIGRMNDEGLAKGMLGGIRLVSRSASEVAQASADAMSFKPNNGFGRLAAMSAGYNNNQNSIDYDRLADAVASRPAYFDVNGKRIATATVTDNSEALTARNKRILAGVGSV